MKKSVTLVGYIIAVLVTVFLTNMVLLAGEKSFGTVTVVATVLPQRVIIVNEDLTIQRIISNTAEDVRPIVFLGSAGGKELPYSSSIAEQYQYLSKTINFSQPGEVYEREERLIPALLERIWRRVTMLFR